MGALGHQQLAGSLVGDIPGHVHLNAAHVVQHGLESLHVNGHILVHRQLEQLRDLVGQVVDAVLLVRAVGVQLVDLAGVGRKPAAQILARIGIAGDLERVHLAGIPVDLHIQDHVGHALALGVVAALVVRVVVDSQQQKIVKPLAIFLDVRVLLLVQLARVALVQGGGHLAVQMPHVSTARQHQHQYHHQRNLCGGPFFMGMFQKRLLAFFFKLGAKLPPKVSK